jgi:hypothetical protein
MAAWRMKLVAMVVLFLVAASPLRLQRFALHSPQPAGCHSPIHHRSDLQTADLQTADHGCCQGGHGSPWVKAVGDAVPSPAVNCRFHSAWVFSGLPRASPWALTFSGGPPISPPLLI